jgi:DNA polymerase-3 subunit epsilon
MAGGAIRLEDTFYRLVNPDTKLTAESVIIHEITPSEVAKKPDIEHVLEEFLEFCGSDIVVGHCVSIDLAFINREMKKRSGEIMLNPVLDTSAVYQWIQERYSSERVFPGSFSDSGLYEIARHFGIPVNGAHNALMDAFITAQVLQRFLPMLFKRGIVRIGDLLKLGNPSKGGGQSGTHREMYGL